MCHNYAYTYIAGITVFGWRSIGSRPQGAQNEKSISILYNYVVTASNKWLIRSDCVEYHKHLNLNPHRSGRFSIDLPIISINLAQIKFSPCFHLEKPIERQTSSKHAIAVNIVTHLSWIDFLRYRIGSDQNDLFASHQFANAGKCKRMK